MDKDKADDYYYFGKNFYESILLDLKYNSLIFYAVYENKIIAMAIILFNNRKMHYHLSAVNKQYQHLAPTNFLLYEAACWGHENGYKTFHLGEITVVCLFLPFINGYCVNTVFAKYTFEIQAGVHQFFVLMPVVNIGHAIIINGIGNS